MKGLLAYRGRGQILPYTLVVPKLLIVTGGHMRMYEPIEREYISDFKETLGDLLREVNFPSERVNKIRELYNILSKPILAADLRTENKDALQEELKLSSIGKLTRGSQGES